MADDRKTRSRNPVLEDFRRLRVGAWIAIAVLLSLLVLAIVYVSSSGTSDLAAGLSGPGTIAMIFGVLFTLSVGVGLMGLIFYSSRRGYDDQTSGDRKEQDREP